MTLIDDEIDGRQVGAPGPGHAEIDVCGVDDLPPDRGVCALVAGAPVALFRVSALPGEGRPVADELLAVGNIDPFSSASVLSRGIVGSIGDRPVVASPLYKNRFDLRTGESLDDPAVRLPVYPVRVVGGRVVVGAAPAVPGDAAACA